MTEKPQTAEDFVLREMMEPLQIPASSIQQWIDLIAARDEQIRRESEALVQELLGALNELLRLFHFDAFTPSHAAERYKAIARAEAAIASAERRNQLSGAPQSRG